MVTISDNQNQGPLRLNLGMPKIVPEWAGAQAIKGDHLPNTKNSQSHR